VSIRPIRLDDQEVVTGIDHDPLAVGRPRRPEIDRGRDDLSRFSGRDLDDPEGCGRFGDVVKVCELTTVW
jgi:hypothetical protein